MVAVHTFEVYPTVEELNEAVGRAFLARLNTLIDEAGADSRVNLAISGGAITTSLLPSLLPSVDEIDWSHVRVWLVDERYVPAGDEDRNDEQAWEGFLHAASGVEFVRMPTSDAYAPGAGSLDEATVAFADTWREIMGEGSFDITLPGTRRYGRGLPHSGDPQFSEAPARAHHGVDAHHACVRRGVADDGGCSEGGCSRASLCGRVSPQPPGRGHPLPHDARLPR